MERGAGTRRLPACELPKPVLTDGLRMLRSVSTEVFATADYKRGLGKAFVADGLTETDDGGNFAAFARHARDAHEKMKGG